MLIDVDTYQTITGDTASATGVVEDAIVEGQRLLEERLGRGLELAERTERLRAFPDGSSYPHVTPLVTVPATATVQGVAVVGGYPTTSFLVEPTLPYVDFTYTGGYDPDETDPAEATYLPRELARAVAWAAKAVLTPADELSIPAGATSVSVGDVSISWGPGGSPATGEVTFPRGVLARYRWRGEMAA